MPHDFNRPFVAVAEMENYFALQNEIAVRYGRIVKAVQISNREYRHRHIKLSATQNMMDPPGSEIHICSGYLVVRKLGTTEQYETWMPDDAFGEMYALEKPTD